MKKLFIIFILINVAIPVLCQPKNDTLFLAFWNTENLFDTVDDPEINDEAFLPAGEMEWTDDRLDKKMYNLSRVIRMLNNGNGPDVLGVSEVENKEVLE